MPEIEKAHESPLAKDSWALISPLSPPGRAAIRANIKLLIARDSPRGHTTKQVSLNSPRTRFLI
jgi:hypothetical protein